MAMDDVLEALTVTLHGTARVLRVKLDQRLGPFGFTQAKWRTALSVHRAGEGITQKALAERLGIEGPTLVRLLDRLEEDGWVERRTCLTDRRSKRIFLREPAQQALKQISAVAAQLRHEVLAGISEDDLRHCQRILQQIRERAERLS